MNSFYILKLVWKICPGRIAAEFLSKISWYASWVFETVYFTKYLVNAMEKKVDFSQIMLFLIISTGVFSALSAFEMWCMKKYRYTTDAVIYNKVNSMLFEKAANVELECYEDVDFYNKYTLAMKECEARFTSILNNVPLILAAAAASVVVVWNMYCIDHFVILFIAAPMLGSFFFGKLTNKVVYTRDKEGVPYKRRMDYVNRVVYLPDYAKEMRMTNVFQVLHKAYEEGFAGLYATLRKYEWKGVALGTVQNIFTFFIIFQGVMIYGLYKTMVKHTITNSEFAVLASAMVAGAWMLIFLSQAIVEMYQNNLYIQNLKDFLEYEPKVPEDSDGISPEAFESLEFQKVGFCYKGQEKPSLSEVSLLVKKGEKIAIVGHNGAGKTTLVKLLMRLYDASEGEILYNGRKLQDYHLRKYRSLFATAFQDYQLFSMTVAENVLMRTPWQRM